MGDQGVAGLEALGVLRLLSSTPTLDITYHFVMQRLPSTSSRQRHHPLPALLLLNRAWCSTCPQTQVQLPQAAAAAGGSRAAILGEARNNHG